MALHSISSVYAISVRFASQTGSVYAASRNLWTRYKKKVWSMNGHYARLRADDGSYRYDETLVGDGGNECSYSNWYHSKMGGTALSIDANTSLCQTSKVFPNQIRMIFIEFNWFAV